MPNALKQSLRWPALLVLGLLIALTLPLLILADKTSGAVVAIGNRLVDAFEAVRNW